MENDFKNSNQYAAYYENLERIVRLEKEIESLKARYELLHDAVSPVKEFSGYVMESPGNPTQTLAYDYRLEEILFRNSHNLLQHQCVNLVNLIQSYYDPILQSEYQRGYTEAKFTKEDIYSKRDRWYRHGVAEGRKQAIEEMKEKFEKLISGQMLHTDNVDLFNKIREVFTESK